MPDHYAESIGLCPGRESQLLSIQDGISRADSSTLICIAGRRVLAMLGLLEVLGQLLLLPVGVSTELCVLVVYQLLAMGPTWHQ